MFNSLKEYCPAAIWRIISLSKRKIISKYKVWLFWYMRKKHAKIIEQLKNTDRIRVVFLAIHRSVWKVDTIFKAMLADPYFEPIVLVCPCITFGEEIMREEMRSTLDYFNEKGYPTYPSYIEHQDRWVTLAQLSPDIIFFTNPHNLTRPEYYKDAYLKYLSIYAGYGIPVSKYNNYESQYNQIFHHAVWKIFLQHENSMAIAKKYGAIGGRNCALSGDTTIEELLNESKNELVWKKQSTPKLKVIWAPHHTISRDDQNTLPYSTFLLYFNTFVELVVKFEKTIQFAFKPHPMLKPKLYKTVGWGKKKTDEYYSFWKEEGNTQLEEGEYIDLFKQSDALIHDSGAFTGEYIFLNKPVMHLGMPGIELFFNDFALEAYNCHYKARYSGDIEKFLETCREADPMLKTRESFVEKYSYVYGKGNNGRPSKVILNSIKMHLDSRFL